MPAQPKPASPTRPDAPASRPKHRTWPKYLAAGVLMALLIGAGFATWRLWSLVNAVSQVESAAVVPLPPSQQTMPEPGSTNLAVVEVTPATDPGQSDAAPSDPPAAASGPASVPAAVAVSDPNATSNNAAPSRLDVLREVVNSGMSNGDPGQSSVWNGKTSLNILVIGVDSRADGGDENADVIVIAHLDLVNHAVSAVSLPRDLLVQVPGYGQDKINSAYNHGILAAPGDPVAGVARVRDTIESVFGVPIDGYVLIDFAGFEEIVDAIGGIAIDVPYAIRDDDYPAEGYGVTTITFEPGLQQMDGERALQYVRTRHGDNDDARRERQFQVMLSLFEQGSNLGSITAADDLIFALSQTIQTSFPLDQQLTLARLGFATDVSDISFAVLTQPLLIPGWTADGRWVYTGDMNEISEYIRQSLRTDAPALQTLSR